PVVPVLVPGIVLRHVVMTVFQSACPGVLTQRFPSAPSKVLPARSVDVLKGGLAAGHVAWLSGDALVRTGLASETESRTAMAASAPHHRIQDGTCSMVHPISCAGRRG